VGGDSDERHESESTLNCPHNETKLKQQFQNSFETVFVSAKTKPYSYETF